MGGSGDFQPLPWKREIIRRLRSYDTWIAELRFFRKKPAEEFTEEEFLRYAQMEIDYAVIRSYLDSLDERDRTIFTIQFLYPPGMKSRRAAACAASGLRVSGVRYRSLKIFMPFAIRWEQRTRAEDLLRTEDLWRVGDSKTVGDCEGEYDKTKDNTTGEGDA